jgi:hypothetical protein
MRYLILTYYRKANGQIDEQMAVTKRVKPNDIQTANVILDFKKLDVVKCSMGNIQVNRDWDHIVSYYYQHYANVIERLFNENGHVMAIGTPTKTEAPAQTA